MNLIYFQPRGINPKYCEAGIRIKKDPGYIYYIDEPCKILEADVKIIPKDRVKYDKGLGLYVVSE